MTAGFFLRSVVRESRGSRGRLLFLAACLAVGVAAVVAVDGLTGGIEAGVRAKSREVMGADLSVEGRRPLPKELDGLLSDQPGIERTDLREMATMAALSGPDGKPLRARLCQLRVVRGRYPLHGALTTEPAAPLDRLLADDRSAVAARELLDALGIGVGDRFLVGGAEFRVAASLEKEAGRVGLQAMLGPRVYLNDAGLARTKLTGVGNRVLHRALFALPGDPPKERLDALARRLEKDLPGASFLDVDTHHGVDANQGRAMERLSSTVALTALLSLVLGGIGVAQIVRAWLDGRASAVAVLRCLGMRPGEILAFHLGHVAILAIAGSAAGAAIGAVAPLLVPALAPELFPLEHFRAFSPGALLRGVGLGVGVAILFALPPLTAIWRVPPARVLRAEADPLPAPRGVSAAAAILLAAGVFLAAWAQGGALDRAAWFTGGFAALVGILALGAKATVRLAGRLPRGGLHPVLRHGVAALARPGAGTRGAMVALGLGTMVVVGMWLVETRVLEGLRAAVPPGAPTVFLVDVPPDRWDEVRALLLAEKAEAVDHVPVVTARLSSVDGRPVEDLAAEAADGERARWVLTREQRLTWRRDLPSDNRVLEGALWSDPHAAECSLEERFARDLGAKVGTTLVFDIQGVPLESKVTSIRSVEWTSFAINFFVILEPGALDGAPGFVLANARMEPDAEARFQDRLAAGFPSATMIRVRPLVERIVDLLRRVAFGIRVLGSFTVFAGLAILAGAVSASAVRRGREAALLKTLGVTRAGVAGLLAAEYGLVGLVAGAVGAGGAAALAWGFLDRVTDLPVTIPWLSIPVGAAGCAALAAGCGLLASLRALNARPLESLRM